MFLVLILLILPVARQVPAGAVAVNTSKGAAFVVVWNETLLALSETERYHTLQRVIERADFYTKPKV